MMSFHIEGILFIWYYPHSILFLFQVMFHFLQTPDDLDSLYEKYCNELQAENAELANFTPVLLKKGEMIAAAAKCAPSGPR